MSKWQLLSDGGKNFRWEISPSTKSPASNHGHIPSSSPSSPRPRLPSFQDGLLQGCSILLEDSDAGNHVNDNNKRTLDEDVATFRTGLGKSVVLNKSSIAKAASVLDDDFPHNFDPGQPSFKGHEFSSPDSMFSMGLGKNVGGNGFSSPNSMFRTGSGKNVDISSAGLLRAKTLLGAVETSEDCTSQDFKPARKKVCGSLPRCEQQPDLTRAQMVINGGPQFLKAAFHPNNGLSKGEVVDEDTSKLMQLELCNSSAKSSATKVNSLDDNVISISNKRNVDEDVPMFRTGSGNSVLLNRSSIAKAASVLGCDFGHNFDTAQLSFKGNDFSSPDSMFSMGLGKNVGGKECSSPHSMFQTGSGKIVNISSAGLLRAKALLGAVETSEDCTFQGFETARKKICGSVPRYEQQSNLTRAQMLINDGGTDNDALLTTFPQKNGLLKGEVVDKDTTRLMQAEFCSSSTKSSAIKFNTAGGRPISVSSDALQRARSLLGDPEIDNFLDEGSAGASMVTSFKQGSSDVSLFNKEKKMISSLSYHQLESSDQNLKIFVSPMKQSTDKKQLNATSETLVSGINLISKFDAEESICRLSGKPSCPRELFDEKPQSNDAPLHHFKASGPPRVVQPLGGPLADITNIDNSDSASRKGSVTELRRPGRRTSATPFKMPRSSKFVTPLNSDLQSASNWVSRRPPEASSSRRKVSSRYPVLPRTPIKEFLKGPPDYSHIVEQTSDQVHQINSGNSEKYTFSVGAHILDVEAFFLMLVQSGASAQHMKKVWVANHYKLIVWKLASYERFYSAILKKKFLTISNVLEELKYRYEREVNHGHRSAIKRILEGNASPSSMMVLCVSAIFSDGTSTMDTMGDRNVARVELTDGWYSIHAQLDPELSKHLVVGKLFVGQKIRVCGAGLNAWEGPVSPLEASGTVSLLLHINGTFRVNWDARLGFCRCACAPLAFKCIKVNGGSVPRTVVGVTRIYPVLYRERLKSGGFVVRSEKMEAAIAQLYNQRRSNIIEAITSDFQRASSNTGVAKDYDNEGAKISKMLENTAEPELMMAEMSSEQLALFSSYRARVEETRQCDLQRLIEKAFEDEGLIAREVSPFMRVRVVGLKSKGHVETKDHKEGLITLWNPTERQKLELVEGHAYAISGLMPLHSDMNTLYLQARGSGSRWQCLTTLEKEFYMPFFNRRKPMLLAKLGEVPLSSEFDTAILVLHVGLEFVAGQQKKQWIFVTDGSFSESESAESTISLLAISFCSPRTDDDSVSPINPNLVGSVVCFCNLVKRAKDHVNHMWVAEATENSTYYITSDHQSCSHLKDAFGLVKKWEQSSSSTVENLKNRILYIVGGPKV